MNRSAQHNAMQCNVYIFLAILWNVACVCFKLYVYIVKWISCSYPCDMYIVQCTLILLWMDIFPPTTKKRHEIFHHDRKIHNFEWVFNEKLSMKKCPFIIACPFETHKNLAELKQQNSQPDIHISFALYAFRVSAWQHQRCIKSAILFKT